MTSKIYKKTFIKESQAAIEKIDNHLAFVEDGIGELNMTLRKLTKGNMENLAEESKSNVSDYQDRIDRMDKCLSDLYSLKNDLLDDLERMSEE